MPTFRHANSASRKGCRSFVKLRGAAFHCLEAGPAPTTQNRDSGWLRCFRAAGFPAPIPAHDTRFVKVFFSGSRCLALVRDTISMTLVSYVSRAEYNIKAVVQRYLCSRLSVLNKQLLSRSTVTENRHRFTLSVAWQWHGPSSTKHCVAWAWPGPRAPSGTPAPPARGRC